MGNGKAPGADGICIEMLKTREPEIACILVEVFKHI